MNNSNFKYDFLIVGAGLIGALTGLVLLKKGLKVLVIDKNTSMINDQRTLAVNANSKDFLQSLGIWQNLRLIPEPINKIKIANIEVNKKINFFDQFEPLGYVAFNHEILSLAREQLIKKSSLLFETFVSEKNLKPQKQIILNKKKYEFKHIIFSTGKSKNLNDQNIIPSKHIAYVGFFNHSNSHQNIAYENFTSQGPLAILPAPSKNKLYSTFIYSTSDKLNLNSLRSVIKKNFSKTHGQIKLSKEYYQFKIMPKIIKENLQDTIFIGDAFRSIHPVAGQGWNLGIKDIQALVSLIDDYKDDNKLLVKMYYSKRNLESLAYLSFTTFINGLFENTNLLKNIFVKLAFRLFNQNKILKTYFIKQAMGRSNFF